MRVIEEILSATGHVVTHEEIAQELLLSCLLLPSLREQAFHTSNLLASRVALQIGLPTLLADSGQLPQGGSVRACVAGLQLLLRLGMPGMLHCPEQASMPECLPVTCQKEHAPPCLI